MDENKPRRRWLSFGVRDLLWALVVAGFGVGWWMDHHAAQYKFTELQKDRNSEFDSFAQTMKRLQFENRELRRRVGLSDDPFAD